MKEKYVWQRNKIIDRHLFDDIMYYIELPNNR